MGRQIAFQFLHRNGLSRAPCPLSLLPDDDAGGDIEEGRHPFAVNEPLGGGDEALAEFSMLLCARQDAAGHDESKDATIGKVMLGAKGEKQGRQLHLREQVGIRTDQQLVALKHQLPHPLLIVPSLNVAIREPRRVTDDESELAMGEQSRSVGIFEDEAPNGVGGWRLHQPTHQSQVVLPQRHLLQRDAQFRQTVFEPFTGIQVGNARVGKCQQSVNGIVELVGRNCGGQVEGFGQIAGKFFARCLRQSFWVSGDGEDLLSPEVFRQVEAVRHVDGQVKALSMMAQVVAQSQHEVRSGDGDRQRMDIYARQVVSAKVHQISALKTCLPQQADGSEQKGA